MFHAVIALGIALSFWLFQQKDVPDEDEDVA